MDDEAVWIQRARAGDRAAFGRLVELYQRPVFSLAYRMLGSACEAEDAAQECFLRAYRALGGYDRGRAFSTWLLSIAAHHCIDRLRRRRTRDLQIEAVREGCLQCGPEAGPQARAEMASEAEAVRAALAALPEDYRVVVVLRYWHDMGYAEIASILGDTESAIKSRLHRARLKLAETLSVGSGLERDSDAAPKVSSGPPGPEKGRVKPCNANAPAS